MSSSLNTLIGTFSSIDNNNTTTIDSSNLICIDTSTNRIGINTIDPSYSITIMNHSINKINSSNAIATPKLYITEISGINIVGQTMSAEIYNRFEVYCDLRTNKVGKFIFEIEKATYMISADPKNHLRSTMIFIGKNLDNNENQIIMLRSSGNDIHFTTMDQEAKSNFGCYNGLIYLYNKKLYETIVKDLNLPILDFHISYNTTIKTDY